MGIEWIERILDQEIKEIDAELIAKGWQTLGRTKNKVKNYEWVYQANPMEMINLGYNIDSKNVSVKYLWGIEKYNIVEKEINQKGFEINASYEDSAANYKEYLSPHAKLTMKLFKEKLAGRLVFHLFYVPFVKSTFLEG